MRRFLLFALVASCLAAEEHSYQEAAEALREEIFLLGNEILTPYNLGEKLKLLSGLYHSGKAQPPNKEWATRVARLVEAGNYLDSSKCRAEALEEVQSLMEETATFSVAIFQYLHHCRSELFNKCNFGMTLKLEKAARQMDTTEFKDLEDLHAKVKASGSSLTLYLRVPKEQMVAGVTAFLATKGSHKRILDHQDAYEKYILQPCRRFQEKVDHLLGIYGKMLFKQDLFRQVKPKTLQFIELGKVCELALNEHRSLKARSYKF